MGVHGVLINGSTGEWFAQSVKERKRVAELAVEAIGNDFPVVVGCSSFTPAVSIELGQHAAEAGAHGILLTPPPYVVPTEAEVLEFYREVVGEVGVPTMVYNWPRGTGMDMSAELMAQLGDLAGVAAVKDSTPDYGRHLATLRANGSGSRYFAHYMSRLGIGVLNEVGGVGSIDGGPLGARYGVKFYDAYHAGDLDAARENADSYDALLRDLVGYNYAGLFGSQISQIKAAMRMMGMPGGYCRRPLQELDDAATSRLAVVLRKHGLL